MKILILLSLICLQSGSLHAQNEFAQEVKKVSLVEWIEDSDAVYKLEGFDNSENHKWNVLAGNRDVKPNYFYYLSERLGSKRIEALKK